MKIYFPFLACIALLYLNSCSSAKKLISPPNTIQFDNVDSLLQFFQSSRKFNFLLRKGNVIAQIQSAKEEFQVQLACKSDSAMTLSFRQLGFEGIKVLIRTDSIFVINRLEKTYSSESFEGFVQKLGFEIDYYLLQDFLLFGHMIINEGFYSFSQNATQYIFTGNSEQIQSISYLHKPNLDTLQFEVNFGQFVLHSTVSQIVQNGQVAFPVKHNFSIQQEDKIILKSLITWDDFINFERKSLHFIIPNHYQNVAFSFYE